jgi:hypothetical protein
LTNCILALTGSTLHQRRTLDPLIQSQTGRWFGKTAEQLQLDHDHVVDVEAIW